jgi:hypothetical protein
LRRTRRRKRKRCIATETVHTESRDHRLSLLSPHRSQAPAAGPTSWTSVLANMESMNAARLSVNDVATIMSIALGTPPASPPGCLQLLTGCWTILLDKRYPGMFVDHADFFRQCAHFVTVTRTSEEMSELELSLSICRCQTNEVLRLAPKDLHHHSFQMDVSYSSLVYGLCQALLLRWERGRVVLYRSVGRSSWPRSLHDVTPACASSAVFMLTTWISRSGIAGTIIAGTMLRRIVDFSKAAAVVGIIRGRGMLWTWLEQYAHAITLMFPEDAPTSQTAESAKNMMKFLLSMGLLTQRMSDVLFDEEFLLWTQYDGPGFPQKLVRTIVKIIQALPTIRNAANGSTGDGFEGFEQAVEESRALWAYILIRILRFYPETSPVDIPSLFMDASHDDVWQRRNIYFRYLTSKSGWRHRCSAPACLETHASVGRVFQVCGYCKEARYCSRRCQRLAWRHPASAHRDICPGMRRLRIALAMYPEPMRDEAKLARKISPEEAKRVETGIAIIRQSKLSRLGPSWS